MSLLPTPQTTLSLVKATTKEATEKLETVNNENNNKSDYTNSSPTKNTTHSTLIQQNENNNSKHNGKNLHENENNEKTKCLRESLVQNEIKNQTPTQQQKIQKQEMNKNQTQIEKEVQKIDLKSMATMATVTCDTSSDNKNNNKNNSSVLGNEMSNNYSSVSGSDNGSANVNVNLNNNENKSQNTNAISLITANGIQIKVEECDENVQIKTEETDVATDGSSSSSSNSLEFCAPNGVASTATTQLTTAIDVDNNLRHQKQQKPRHDNDSKEKKINSSGTTNNNKNNNKNVTAVKQQQLKIRQEQQKHQEQQPEQNDPNDLIFARPKPVPLTAVNPHIICNLCYGYLIDATTIVECLHSFCHSCLIKHLRTEQYCPRCEMMINTAKPNIKPDTTLQAIVYKLVPGLYEKELLRRRAFYKNHPVEAASATPEQRGDDTEHLIFSPSEYMSLSLEYADIDEHVGSNTEYSELLNPRYLQCPAKFTVAHMKKFVHSKFSIDCQRFNIDIMYKVKTIVLLDHYTVMDIAYIYTWKRDAPMRFFFRVKECLKPIIKQEKYAKATSENSNTNYDNRLMTVIHTPLTPVNSPPQNVTKLLPLTEIKVEDESENFPMPTTVEKHFEIVSPRSSNGDKKTNGNNDADNLKITIISKPVKDAKVNGVSSISTSIEPESSNKATKHQKEKRVSFAESPTEESAKDERKVENIKLKIDLTKQNSVTIINMSHPERKEIVKPVNNRSIEKEWKVKNKKEKEQPNKSPTNSKNTASLTVPPLTLNRAASTSSNAASTSSNAATKVSPKGTTTTTQNSTAVETSNIDTEDLKSQFLKSFALAPISSLKNAGSPKKPTTTTTTTTPQSSQQLQKSPPKHNSDASFVFKQPNTPLSLPGLPKILPLVQKRKNKEPIKTTSAKKSKLMPPMAPPEKMFNVKGKDDFKIKLPSKDNSLSPTKTDKSANTTNGKTNSDQLMPPPSSLPPMRPPSSSAPKKSSKSNNVNSKIPTSNGILPHPTMPGVQVAAPGSRTPIAKRYQPILPKAARPNPFADLPSAVNQILIDNCTEIKTINSERTNITTNSKIYGTTATTPKNTAKVMGPPPVPKQKPQSAVKTPTTTTTASASLTKPNSSSTSNSYLNYALFNASKTKGNEVPPGCRTPMYSPNSPIYSPSSPQYAPNYNIPTVPQYKYTPKPHTGGESILQSILGGNSAMSSLFPSPPTKKSGEALNKNQAQPNNYNSNKNTNNVSTNNKKGNSPQQQTGQKRAFPFARSPSPSTGEDPPEKQLKVKSLLNSCNINIPSSLSITITRDDGESTSNNIPYPKHKSPVNNYIEILKLPEPTTETTNSIANKQRQSPPANSLTTQKQTLPATNNVGKSNCSNLSTALKNFRPNNNGTRTTPPPPLPMPITKTSSTPQLNTLQLPQMTQRKLPSPTLPPSVTLTAYDNSRVNQMKPMISATNQTNNKKTPSPKSSPHPESNTKSPNQKTTQAQTNEKKNSSPEKRTAPTLTSPPNDSKQQKLTNATVDGTKKFRPILPRQDVQAMPEIVPQKVTNANIIGTYASPSGVSVNVHGNKKVTPPKKSPNMQLSKTPTFNAPTQMQMSPQQQQQQKLNQLPQYSGLPTPQQQQRQHQQQQKPINAFKTGAPRTIASSRYSPTVNNSKKQNPSPNALQAAKKTPPPTSSPKSMPGNKTLANLTTTPPPTSLPQQPPPPQLPTTQQQQTTRAPSPAVTVASTTPQNAAAAQLAMMAAAPNAQNDFTKLFKENWLRAQAHAAAAANPAANMLYSYANAAAAAQVYNASTTPLYSYQHAYILDQISRMQRANNEALLGEYVQKLKNVGLDATNTTSPPGLANPDQRSTNSNTSSTTAVSKDAAKAQVNKAK